MSKGLPEGWTRIRVADAFRIFSGATPSRNNKSYWNGRIPWVSSGDVKSSRISTGSEYITRAGLEAIRGKQALPGSIIVVIRSGVLKHTLPVAIVDAPVAINQDIKCLDSGSCELNYWLSIALRSSAHDILSENREGTTVQSVKSETLQEFMLAIPPLAEQRRIVQKLEAVLGKVAACRARLARIPALLKRFRQAVLAAACSGHLTADWRSGTGITESGVDLLKRIKTARIESASSAKQLRQIEEAFATDALRLDASELRTKEMPESWAACRIGAIGAVCNGSTPSRKQPSYWNGDIPWVSSGEVKNCVVKNTREQITQLGFEAASVRLLPRGTVLLAMIGEGKTRGQSAILDIETTINQNIAAIDISHGLVQAKYLWYWLQLQYELTREEGSGSGPQALNCQRVRELPFLLPGACEQREVVNRIESLFAFADQLEARLAKATAQVEKLTQSVLAKAFRGELVPTEAELARREGRDYEPASALLDRLRAARATTAAAPKRARRKSAKSS